MAEQPLDNLNTTGTQPPGHDKQGRNLGHDDAAQVPPGSKTGSDNRQSAGANASTGGPGGPDAGSDAMPGRSNAL